MSAPSLASMTEETQAVTAWLAKRRACEELADQFKRQFGCARIMLDADETDEASRHLILAGQALVAMGENLKGDAP